MNLNYYYWYFKKELSPHFCNKIIDTALKRKKLLGITHEETKIAAKKKNFKKLSKKNLKDLRKIRDSSIVWMDDPWIYEVITPYVNKANENAGWNYDIDWTESCQFTIYGKDQHYGWHNDSYKRPYNMPHEKNFHGKIRKLSVSISLSDPKDYKGGDLEFDFRNNNNGKPNICKCKELKPQGSIVVFPSYIWHRVKPVTSGTRYSLVLWNIGTPFK